MHLMSNNCVLLMDLVKDNSNVQMTWQHCHVASCGRSFNGGVVLVPRPSKFALSLRWKVGNCSLIKSYSSQLASSGGWCNHWMRSYNVGLPLYCVHLWARTHSGSTIISYSLLIGSGGGCAGCIIAGLRRDTWKVGWTLDVEATSIRMPRVQFFWW